MASFQELSEALDDSLENLSLLIEIAVPNNKLISHGDEKEVNLDSVSEKDEEVSLDPITDIQNPELAALTEIAKNLAIIGQILAQWAQITSHNP